MGVLLIGAMGQSFLLQLKSQPKIKFCALITRILLIASSEDLADGVIQIDGYDYVGYLRYPSVQKTSLREPKVA